MRRATAGSEAGRPPTSGDLRRAPDRRRRVIGAAEERDATVAARVPTAKTKRRRAAPRAVAAPEFHAKGHVTEVAGTVVAWHEQGAGEDLVLLHGVGDSHLTWRRVAPLLAERYRVLMPDLPGHGQSGRPDAPYTLEWFAGVIAAWMEAIDVPHAHIVGHSFGGGVAQWLLLDHRERVDRLALIAAGGLGRGIGLALRLAAIPLPERLFTPTAMWFGSMAARLLDRRSFGDLSLAEIRDLARATRVPGTGRAFCRTLRGVVNVLGQYQLTRDGIGVVATLPPMAMFWGAVDPIIPVQHGRLGLDIFVDASLEVIPGCGHYPHVQDPERVAAGLLAFLDAGRGQAKPSRTQSG